MPEFFRNFLFDFLLNPHIQANFLAGLLLTVRLSVVSSVLAILTGLVMAFLRQVSSGIPSRIASGYVELFRNTPLLIQLYLFYRGLSAIGVVLTPEICGMLALSLYTGAYLTEVFRAGLLAVPREQLEAGLSLGFSRWQVYRMVLIPQAVRLILPAVGNQLISLTKNSSLVAFITVSDLFFVVYKGAVDNFQPMEYFLEGAALYLMLSLTTSAAIHLLERWLNRPRRHPASPAEALACG